MGLPPELIEFTLEMGVELIPDRRKRRHAWAVIVGATIAMVLLAVGMLWLMQ